MYQRIQHLNTVQISIFHQCLFFVGLHSILWILMPLLLQPNVNLDVAESYAWGQELSAGYYKHPLLAPWLTYLISQLEPGSLWPIFTLSQCCVLITFACAYWLATKYISIKPALTTVFLLTFIPYFNYTTPEFNPNVLELPIWALTICFTYQCLKKPNKIIYWILLGFLSGLSVLTKYYSGILLICILVYFLSPYGRDYWKIKGPYIALISFLVTVAPNLIWLINSDFIAIEYAINRSSSSNPPLVTGHVLHPLKFITSQALVLSPLIIACYFANKTLNRSHQEKTNTDNTQPKHFDADKFFLSCISIGPFLLTLMLSVIAGIKIRTMWGTPLFTFIPLYIFLLFPQLMKNLSLNSLRKAWFVVQIFLISIFTLEFLVLPTFGKVKTRQHFPGQHLTDTITKQWNQTIYEPIAFAAGSTWLSSTLAFYSNKPISVITDYSFEKSPWAQSKENFSEKGGVILWDKSSTKEVRYYETILSEFQHAILQPPIQLPWQSFHQPEKPVSIGWAIIPPMNSMLHSTSTSPSIP